MLSLKINGIQVFAGDAASILIDFNNLSGWSFIGNDEAYASYLKMIGAVDSGLIKSVLLRDNIEVFFGNFLIKFCKVGDDSHFTEEDLNGLLASIQLFKRHPEIHVDQARDGKWNFRRDDNAAEPGPDYYENGSYSTNAQAARRPRRRRTLRARS